MNEQVEQEKIVEIDYTNYRGVRAWRLIQPVGLAFAENQWHRPRQHLMLALDIEGEGMPKTFAIMGIHGFRKPSPERLQKYCSGQASPGLSTSSARNR